MTKAEQKRIDSLESALKVIRTWASFFHDGYYTASFDNHKDNLKAIADKCNEALGKEKK